MSEELLINVSPMESRVAVLDNGVLGEIYIERHHKLGLVGNIYLGTVVRVLPGMQAAFVDIGQSRTAFLHVNDMQREPRPQASIGPSIVQMDDKTADKNDTIDSINSISKINKTTNDAPSTNEKSATVISADNINATPPVVLPKSTVTIASKSLIQNRLHESQRVLVQVTKDQLGSKGARLTTNISLPSRYLVYLPSSDHIGISQRIDSIDERTRLKTELTSLMQTVNLKGGLIARTAAERVPVDKLEEDIYYLLQLWRTICARRQEITHHQSSELIYQELSLPLRSIRDLVHSDTEKVIIDNAQIYEQVLRFAKEFVPFIEERIVHYTAEPALFDVHRVEEDLRDALKRRVDLKSGGYLIIDQTEAMTTIDVNTGSYVGGRSLEDTVYKTNLEATHAIASQLRLRNLGGIIILDFIDMLEQEHKDDVLTSLREQLVRDYAKTNITQVSELGLVEMTRKRTRESLGQQLCEPCVTCQGRGFIKTAETVCFEIFREMMRCARTYNSPKKFTVVAHAAVIDLLLTSEADTVADLEYLLGRVITFEVENLYTQEQYDIVLD
ncbi:Rne/Rng family ribonuclease [Psychrobacter sp. M13]|uniref:Rne/Rng family ribonuclease n=1 Tax=Psychrobacter sp. M13 TaxID=3067275 RepID=UPI00273B6C99|nr:Rne/Rng family ribonuclease [Psychrobacter sp. M13]WLP95077.1 Rne/Rng family ribonuclease [Psychrobacter sp. M13]